MKLTDPIRLSLEDADAIVPDMAAIALSSLTMTPLGQLRYGTTTEAELSSWLRACWRSELPCDLQPPRIADFDTDGLGPNVMRMEYLAVRDLDMEPLSDDDGAASNNSHDGVQAPASAPASASASGGRIVAFAEFKYHPREDVRSHQQEEEQQQQQQQQTATQPPTEGMSGGDQDGSMLLQPPPSVHNELRIHWDNLVETALHRQFGGMHCFEVRGLSTLSPSHLRRGIASKLLGWIFPWADRLNVPVVLAATPPGYPLYLKHGFAPVGPDDGAIECDMADWGGSGVHRHVLMIRWPEKNGSR
jgi:GNAT superfamily N-acetyltransferase